MVLLALWVLSAFWFAVRQPRPLPDPQLAWAEVSPTISFDGQAVAFEITREARQAPASAAFGKASSEMTDIAIFARDTEQMRYLSRPQGACKEPQLSGDAKTLVFTSMDSSAHLISLFVANTETLESRQISTPWRAGGHGSQVSPAISSNGKSIAFLTFRPGTDPSEWLPTIAIGDPASELAETPFHEIPWAEPSGAVAVSPDGTRLAWESRRMEKERLSMQLLSAVGSDEPEIIFEGEAGEPTLSNSLCAFVSPDLQGVYQIMLLDFESGKIRAITRGNDDSLEPTLSADGKRLAFTSYANNLVTDDKNQKSDIFFYDLDKGDFQGLTTGSDDHSFKPHLSGDGSTVVFASRASNLDEGFTSGAHIYVWESGWQRCQGIR